MQEVVAQGFQRELELYGKPDSYFVQLPKELQQKRDWLVQSLDAVGMKPIVPEGTYFLVADISEFSESRGCGFAQAGLSTGRAAWSGTTSRDRNLHKPPPPQQGGTIACSPSKLPEVVGLGLG